VFTHRVNTAVLIREPTRAAPAREARDHAAPRPVEITDLLVDIDPASGARRRVSKDAIVHRLLQQGDARAARAVRALPSTDGYLDDDAVDRLVVAVHREIQRLSEEFRHGARMAALIDPILAAMRAGGVPGPYRVVDIGCGTGYVTRWLSRNAPWDDVRFVGVDHHAALVDEATRLAEAEDLDCRFATADAFALAEPAHVLISTGVLHHFSPEALDPFFARHEAGPALGFVHVDFQPSPIAAFGAWLFHRTRMRLAISRFDGVQSARRAHDPELVGASATWAAPSFESRIIGQRVRHTPFPCVLTTVAGLRRDLEHGDAR
jgi:SAM-dependent methyltransferase